jgi:ankyrin repeat protein
MWFIAPEEPLAMEVVAAIQTGDLACLDRLLQENAGLATARIGTANKSRTLLHTATDWPGHFPNGPATVKMLVAAGAEVNARVIGPHHSETPLHWAASSDDVAVLDALLDAGADIEADGAIIGGGTPLADAAAFGQWQAARRLVERGANTSLWQAAALGLMDRVVEYCSRPARLPADEITRAFWCACQGGQRDAAKYLFDHGADLNWIGYNGQTPLDVAQKCGRDDVVAWLAALGAKRAGELA